MPRCEACTQDQSADDYAFEVRSCCFHLLPCEAAPEADGQDTPLDGEMPDQRGGDDGTRTHDPLLANTPDPDGGEQ